MSLPRKPFRIFISSPGDVSYERSIARNEIARLAQEAGPADFFDLQVVSWDDPNAPAAMLANQAPQAALRRQLVDPGDCDLVIVIFWSRMGTPLTGTDFRKQDGSLYLSGTEWEFENALHSKSRPDMLVYRRVDIINVDPDDPSYEESIRQQSLVSQFFKQFVQNDGTMNGFHHKYKGTEEFRDRVRKDILSVLRLRVDDASASTASADPEARLTPRWKVNPYLGLAAYSEDYAEVFCGRDQEVNALLDKLGTHQRCVAVVGASGSGKSSLISGGLLPRLKRSALLNSDTWVVHTIKPAVVSVADGFLWGTDPRRDSNDPVANQANFDRLIDEYLTRHNRAERLIVFIDQVEELVKADDGKIAAYAAAIRAFTACPRVTLLLACRSDLYGDWLEATGLQQLFQSSTFMLASPTPADLIDIIRRPASMAGIEVEDRVIGEILESVAGNAGALPLMSYLLGQLYDRAGASRRFDFATYTAVGGIKAVVSQGAERTFETLTTDQQRRFDDVFALMVTIDERGRTSRVSCPVEQITRRSGAANVLSAFVEARLLTLLERDDGRSVAEISHESLITHWPRLATLVEKQAQHIRWRSSFRLSAERWRVEGRGDERLLQGKELDLAVQAISRSDVNLDDDEQAFVDASVARRAAIRRKARRIQFTVGAGVIVSLVLTCVAVLLVWSGYRESLDTAASLRSSSIAQSLAVTVSQQGDDATLMDLTVAAEFDKGHYETISLVGPDGKPLVSRGKSSMSLDVPVWFAHSVALAPGHGIATIVSGWKPVGQLTVVPDRGRDVKRMWSLLLMILVYLSVTLTVMISVSTMFLARHRALVQAVE